MRLLGFLRKIAWIPAILFYLTMSQASESGYFQQSVHYTIKVRLFPQLNRLEGREWLVYVNHSPDTLRELYFHLYQNNTRLPYIQQKYQKRHEEPGYQEIVLLRDDSGNELPYSLFASLMKVELTRPLFPGDSVALFIRFNTILPEAGERFGYYGDHFDVGNWYPTPAVYDRDGWHTDLHLGGEFFQEWGDFRVEITVPRDFVVAATGYLLNPEVLPDSVESPERTVDYYRQLESDTVVYRFVAPRVHDFAWSADPEFVLRTTFLDSIRIQLFIQPYQLDLWEGQLQVARQTVEWMQKLVGPYPYPVLNVVDGYITAGGIEYPNLVIINDYIQEKRDLTSTVIHEIIHQWFYGMLANNQTRYGWMDEGTTTYFENLITEKIIGLETWRNSPSGFLGKYLGYRENQWREERLEYLNYLRNGMAEPINRHFDWFQRDPFLPYYTGMSQVLTQLQYVLGDSLFFDGFRHYYRKWRFRHPGPDDFRRSFEEVYGASLHWFFEQWLNTTERCDYQVVGFNNAARVIPDQAPYISRITFRRNEPIAMPLDFRVYLKDGSVRDYRIPLNAAEAFHSVADSGLTPWLFKEKEKEVQLHLPAPVTRVVVNPQHRLLETNPFNNSTGFHPPVRWFWLRRQYLSPYPDAYTATFFPFAFYNSVDGLQVGIRSRGNFAYRNYRHTLRLLLGLHSWRPEVDFWFQHPLYGLSPKAEWVTRFYHGAGQSGGGMWVQYTTRKRSIRTRWVIGAEYRYTGITKYALLPHQPGGLSVVEATLHQENWDSGFMPRGWEWKLHGESSSFGSDFSFQQWWLEARARVPVPFDQRLAMRLFAGGQYGQVPDQKRLRMGGASGYDFWQNPFYRARGTLPENWWRNGHLFLGGGGNLRALANQPGQNSQYLTSFSVQLTLGNPLNWFLVYVPYVSDILICGFATAAVDDELWRRTHRLHSEAGLSLTLTRLPFVFNYFDLDQVHVDFPLLVSTTMTDEPFQFRWVLRLDFRKFY